MAIKTPKTLKTRPKTWMSWSCNLPARQLALSSCDTEKKVAMVINMWRRFFLWVKYQSIFKGDIISLVLERLRRLDLKIEG